MNLILCGFPGCGKSYFGKKLAEKLSWQFIDTDELIGDCRVIMRKFGEKYFRDLEEETIKKLKTDHSVIATGGGSLVRESTAHFLQRLGKLFYLKVPLEVLWNRMQMKNEWPAYIDSKNPRASFEQLFQEREALYEKYCITLEVDGK